MNSKDNARIAAAVANIVEIQEVWADSDEQERACFAADIADFRAEIAAIREAAEQAVAQRSWKASAKRIASAISAFAVSSSHGSDARNAEVSRIRGNIDRAERRAFDRGFDAKPAADSFRAEVIEAREAAARWHRQRAEAAAEPVRREVSWVEQQWRDDVKRAGFCA